MKSIFRDLNGSGNKYWNAIQLSVLAAIFGYLFAENLVLSESWEVLSLRSIDDYAIQASVRSMQKALISGDWMRVFGFFHYAYGNAFWLINAILLLPLYIIDDAQTLIVVGRQISLIFVFASIYLVGLIIDRIRPDVRQLKYPVLIAIATMPMVTIVATKFHVNAQCLFLGLLSFYFLVREPSLTRKYLVLSGIFAGMAVGFKLTAIFMTPLLGLTLLNRLWQQGNVQTTKDTMIFCMVFILTAAACTAPALLLFPFYIKDLGATYNTFLLFKNMAASEGTFSIADLLVDSFWFYLSPLSLLAAFFLFVVLVLHDLKRKIYISLYIFGTIVSSVVLVIAVAHKGPIYIATYLLSLSFFIPLGLLGVVAIRTSNLVKIVVTYTIIVLGLFYGSEYRNQILSSYRFFEISKSEKINNQLHALDEMRHLVTPLKLPVRVLQDSSSVFPGTSFTEGVDVAFNYGNLKEKSTWGTFDYILLNSKDYYGKRLTASNRNRELPLSMQSGADLEEATRELLHDTGMFYGRKYRLIYGGYDSLLYKLVSE